MCIFIFNDTATTEIYTRSLHDALPIYWEGFVPPVFDYLQPDGYFKLHEAEISRINRSIDQLEHHRPMTEAKKIIQQLDETRRQTLHNYQSQIKEAKARRDARRKRSEER